MSVWIIGAQIMTGWGAGLAGAFIFALAICAWYVLAGLKRSAFDSPGLVSGGMILFFYGAWFGYSAFKRKCSDGRAKDAA